MFRLFQPVQSSVFSVLTHFQYWMDNNKKKGNSPVPEHRTSNTNEWIFDEFVVCWLRLPFEKKSIYLIWIIFKLKLINLHMCDFHWYKGFYSNRKVPNNPKHLYLFSYFFPFVFFRPEWFFYFFHAFGWSLLLMRP